MRAFRIAVFAALPLFAASCSQTTSPEKSFVARYRVLDADVHADGVMLRWNSLIPEYDAEGSRREVEQPAYVFIERSTEGEESGFKFVARLPGGMPRDSLLVVLPPGGGRTWYRASFLAKSHAPLLISLPSEVTAPVASAERSISLSQASRWSGLDWSPDGTRLLSTQTLASTELELDNVIVNAADGSTTLLPRPPGGSESLGGCRWSPTGDWIAFWSTPHLTNYLLDYRVWIARSEGDSMRSVTESGCWMPAWSAQDSTLVFARGNQIFLMNPFRAGSARPVHDLSARPKRDLSARREDGRIVYASYEIDSHLYVILPSGGEATRLTSEWGTNDDSPAWSPDGTRIAFISNRSGHADVWLLERASGRLRQLTSGQRFVREAASLAWSPDGLEVAVLESLDYPNWRIAFYRP